MGDVNYEVVTRSVGDVNYEVVRIGEGPHRYITSISGLHHSVQFVPFCHIKFKVAQMVVADFPSQIGARGVG